MIPDEEVLEIRRLAGQDAVHRAGEKIVRLANEILKQRTVMAAAAAFLERRRQDGLEFPYDSYPLRMLRREAAMSDGAEEVYIIFDGPPSHDSPRFVEVETKDGRSVRAAEWQPVQRGLWRLGPFLAARKART